MMADRGGVRDENSRCLQVPLEELSSSALTVIGCQEEHLACKRLSDEVLHHYLSEARHR